MTHCPAMPVTNGAVGPSDSLLAPGRQASLP